MHKNITLTLLALVVGALPVAVAHAGLTDTEKALWGSSADAPTTFALPAGRDTDVMAKAQSLLGQWATLDRYMYAMPVVKRSATLLQTGDPTVLNEVGFKILDTPTASGSVITIDVSSFEGKAFEISRQRRDANKRAHLLAYLLEQYAGVQTNSVPTLAPTSAFAPPSAAPSPPTSGPPTQSAPFAPDLQRLRSQLDAGQYDAALKTLDGLRSAVADKAQTTHE